MYNQNQLDAIDDVIQTNLIAAGLDMSMNYYVFAVPMAIGGILAWRTHVR